MNGYTQPRRFTLLCGAAALMVAAASLAGERAAVSDVAPVSCDVRFDQNDFLAGQGQRAVLELALTADADVAVAPAPVNVVFVIDRSESMRGDKIAQVRASLRAAVTRLDARDVLGIVTYSEDHTVVVSAAPVREVRDLAGRLAAIEPGGKTALFGGLCAGLAEVRRYAGESHVSRVILVSDGQTNVGPDRSQAFGRMGVALLKEGISVTTIGIGDGYNEDLMLELSRASDGNSHYLESSQGLADVFVAEVAELKRVVARDLNLRVTVAPGVVPLRILNGSGVLLDDGAQLFGNQFMAGQQRSLFIEVDLAEQAPTSGTELATAKLRYRSEDANRWNVDASADVNFVARQDEVKGQQLSANPDVQFGYNVVWNAVMQEKAVQDLDAGNTADGLSNLTLVYSNLNDWAEREQDSNILQRAAQTLQNIEEIEQQRYSPKLRKQVRTRNFKDLQMQESTY